jgi:phosphoribosylanthranilate isomerase
MALVKICGNTNLEDVRFAINAGADYIGFIFAESKRQISVPEARAIVSQFPDFPNFVGVFVNQPKKTVEEAASELGLRWLQFHGDETALYCASFMERGFSVIKTFRIKDAMSLKRIDEYNVTSFLFDSYSLEKRGGTGVTFDWNLISETGGFMGDRLFLAGGLNVENLPRAIEKVKPYAVDAASGVEASPGKKDPQLLERFIELAHEGLKRHVPESSLPS